jgi:hypothetical protein
VHIPETMNFYRIMSSEYGSVSCTKDVELYAYIGKIQNFLKMQPKYTHKNNTKYIERVIATLLKKTKDFMNDKKKHGIAATLQEKKKYNSSTAHVHLFNNNDIIFKEHNLYLFNDKKEYGIYAIHPQITVNLLDYIDIKIGSHGEIIFNLSDIINLILHIKYVLFIDLSCSSSNGTNQEINIFKTLAENMEGPSITQRIEENLDLSPFESRSPIPESRLKKHLSLNRSRSKKSKSKRSRQFSSLSLTRYKRPVLSKVKPKPKKSTPNVGYTASGFARSMNI